MKNIFENATVSVDLMSQVPQSQRPSEEFSKKGVTQSVESTRDIATVRCVSGYMAVERVVETSAAIDETLSQSFEAWHGVED